MPYEKQVLCLLAAALFSLTLAQEKSSLTFAIDDTASMQEEIDAVKRGAIAIFDTVMKSNKSQIEDFVLVSINDPYVLHRITTREREPLINAINALKPTNDGTNYECAEMSMTGIKLALEKSRPGSLLYVFTDASPKDAEKIDEVTNLAHKKSISVVFGLTGSCYGLGTDIFEKVAKSTGGQVFNIYKDEVTSMINYVITQISSLKPTIITKDFPKGTHEFELPVDGAMKEVVISVAGKDPVVVVIDPTGKPAIADKKISRSMAIVTITEVSAGKYKVRVTSSSPNTVMVKAGSSVHFKHGFSSWIPDDIKETVTRPIAGEPSYISVKLITDDSDEFQLDEVQILDIDNNVLIQKPLQLADEKEQLYISNTTLITPSGLFRIMVKGHNKRTNEEILRYSLTPVQAQSRGLSKVENKRLTVSLIGASTINAKYEEPLLLKCKVSGYPKATVTWEKADGTVMGSELHIQEYPYDYVSSMSIESVVSNEIYKCIAKNSMGEDSKIIQVVTEYFNVTETPQGATVELYKEARFVCKVKSYPGSEITWYKNAVPVSENADIKISPDRSALIVKKMQPNIVGTYSCRVTNGKNRKVYAFEVKIFGVETPKIDKSIAEMQVRDGTNVVIPCPIKQGKPKPTITWSYKAKDGPEYPIKNLQDGHVLTLLNVEADKHEGTYTCMAHNELGKDWHRIDLIFQYPPQIDGKLKSVITANVDEIVNMDCTVNGEPKPSVKLLLNGSDLVLTTRHKRQYGNSGFYFYATEQDIGIYTCQATNYLGTVEKTIDLRINKPATIEVPKHTAFTVMIGAHLDLPCRVEGHPTPEVKWVFTGLSPGDKLRKLSFTSDELHKVELRQIQVNEEGFYTCTASNMGGSMNITYEINVTAPPSIKNKSPRKTLAAVIGDKALLIPCEATGRPKPNITWFDNDSGENIAVGSDWYDVQEDGSLVIKNVDKEAEGTYRCEARNSFGVASDFFYVEVEPYPKPGIPKKTVSVAQGTLKKLQCDVPHEPYDYFRWFKNGKEISRKRDHLILNAQSSDSGIYTCRLLTRNFAKSRTESVRVIVGVPPRFLEDEKEDIALEEGSTAHMDCSAEGSPMPEVFWTHDNKLLNVKTMQYTFNMDFSSKGTYTCTVKNEYGFITRSFTISSDECLLNIETDFKENTPLILNREMKWLKSEAYNGHLRIPSDDYVGLLCPNGFRNLNESLVWALCSRNEFSVAGIKGKSYTILDLQCREKVIPTVMQTNDQCLRTNSNSKVVKVGYNVNGELLKVFEICLDINKKTPLYSKHDIDFTFAGVEPKDINWYDDHLVSYNVNETYDCDWQIHTVSSLLGQWFHNDDHCCFSKRLLVNPRDVSPGLSQMATHTSLNVVPQWSTCNNENWYGVENKVRELAKSTVNTKLSVWTGSFGQLQISSHNIGIHDHRWNEQPVPKYLWKVVQDPSTQASIAIVQLNIPDIKTVEEAYRHKPCTDICNEVPWLQDVVSQWRDFSKGFTFCCRIHDFERAFGYSNVFNSGLGKVLYNVDSSFGGST